MAQENTKIVREQGGEKLVVLSGGTIEVQSGGIINVLSGGIVKAAGTQAAAIADATAITGGEAPTEAEHNALLAKVNSALAALRGAGIIAAA